MPNNNTQKPQVIVVKKGPGCLGCLGILFLIFVGVPIILFFMKVAFVGVLFHEAKELIAPIIQNDSRYPDQRNSSNTINKVFNKVQNAITPNTKNSSSRSRMTGVREIPVRLSFGPNDNEFRAYWNNGSRAAIIEISAASHFSGGNAPRDFYGAKLEIWLAEKNMEATCLSDYEGDVFLANYDTKEKFVGSEQTYHLGCRNISFEYKIRNLSARSSPHKHYAGELEGTLRMNE